MIETASKQVDTLYIFVVEENKSFFEFEDRYQLVKAGTQDLENVVVLPSGKFIISALTFPGYFYKDNNKDAVVDTSKDVDLFGKITFIWYRGYGNKEKRNGGPGYQCFKSEKVLGE